MKILLLNGPNLNMLGTREPSVYGKKTLDSINSAINTYAIGMKINCDFFQSNCEGEIIDKIQSVQNEYDGCIINAGAYTHYSYAIRDAIASVEKPFIEVHISNVNSREDFRKVSYIRQAAIATISGHGFESYTMAVDRLIDHLNGNKK